MIFRISIQPKGSGEFLAITRLLSLSSRLKIWRKAIDFQRLKTDEKISLPRDGGLAVFEMAGRNDGPLSEVQPP